MQKYDFLPIVLGSDENAYGTARLFHDYLGDAPVKPLLLCAKRLNATRDSKLFDVIEISGFDRDEVFPDALLQVLEQRAPDYPRGFVVVPCSDYYTGLLCRHYDHFKGLIRNRFNPVELLETFDTKDRFYALCDKYGLDYPKTAVCTAAERRSAIDALPFDFPIVVKPENSNASDYLHCEFEGKKKVYFFSNRDDYLSMVGRMDRSGYAGKLILQEFIPGGDDAMRVLNSYSDNDGKVRAMCLGQPVLEFYDPSSIGNYAAILSRSDHALYEKMRAFLEELGYVGFSNFDMKYDSRSGRYVLFEINPRLGRSSFFAYAAGMNFIEYLCEDAVYGRRKDCVFNENTALWSHVPTGVLRKYVKDPALRAELQRYPVNYTLWWKDDRNLKRAYRIFRFQHAQFKSFRRYYFDKSGDWMNQH